MRAVRARYGVLCLVLAMAATVVCLFPPTLTDDVSADSAENYEVTGDVGTPAAYGSLADAFKSINDYMGGPNYTITVKGDDAITYAFSLDADKNVTLTSADGNTFKLTVPSSVRHGSVNGNLILENIILDGNSTAGGIEIKSGGSLTMNDGSVIQNCLSPGVTGGGVYVNEN
ncbi:MAG: hypothetical protein LBJ20_05270, partial [Candidatus Methanoplasma sp.]|nr:hypothetical protein [Candidatus Methanoplasma sp.]